jgi:2-oxoglutarate ferredoxin oxidoreductase subunit alpha
MLNTNRQIKQRVVLRFAGDSGDGVQVTGTRMAFAAALAGNEVSTFPDFPAEIRAPAGTLPGVSGFQLHFSSEPIKTPGDVIDVLIAFNPAALMATLKEVRADGIVIINSDKFQERDYKKANIETDLLTDGTLEKYRVIQIPMTTLTLEAVASFDLANSAAQQCKNMFALGVVSWLYDRPLEATEQWVNQRFAKKPEIAQANVSALRAGFNYAETVELLSNPFTVPQAEMVKGHYRQLTGNGAIALACAAIAAQQESGLLVAGYPITPASDILHNVASYHTFGVRTFQAEDEIASIGACIGAAFGGCLALTATSGPGFDLKSEGLGLAVMAELPMVVVDVQRAGPSTGMPTKPEQTDLLAALYGRHGECPIPILAPATPSDCFYMLFEAFQIATKYMTPVIVLSDAFLANTSEACLVPDSKKLPQIKPAFQPENPHQNRQAYARDETTLARTWIAPGEIGSMYRAGGLEKDEKNGNISYSPTNHENMVKMRAEKIARIAQEWNQIEIEGENAGDLLVICWGSTYGAVKEAVTILQKQGHSISMLSLKYLNPLPADLSGMLRNFKKVIVAELNSGQLAKVLRAEFCLDIQSLNKIQGRPFLIEELTDALSKEYTK